MVDTTSAGSGSGTAALQDLLTVVIPTYNRPRLLQRALQYWANVPVRVIVMDGSAEPTPAEDLPHDAPQITYVHDPALLIRRLGHAAQMVRTPFVTLIGDDEFHLASGLGAAVGTLLATPDLVTCMGRAMGFSIAEDGTLNGRQVYPDFSDHVIAGDTAMARMLEHFASYTPSTIYSVVRTHAWRMALGASLEQEFPVFASAEIQIELALSAIGRSRLLPVLHWMRSFETPPVRNEGEVTLTAAIRFHQWWQDPAADNARKAFVEVSARHIAGATQEPEARIADGIVHALDAYVRFVGEMAKKQEAYRHRMAAQASAGQTPALTRCWDGMTGFRDALTALAGSGVAFDEAEIHAVATAIRGHHA